MYFSVCVCVCSNMQVRGQLMGTSSLLLCGTWLSNSGVKFAKCLYPLRHLQPTTGYIFQNHCFASLLFRRQWFPMTYYTVNHCDPAFQSSPGFSSSLSKKSAHCHQDKRSTIWYLSSANYICFAPITMLHLFHVSKLKRNCWSSLDLPMVATPVF